MKYVVLNPQASSSRAQKKWERVSNHFSDHQLTLVDEQKNLIPKLAAGDKIICAGGDGTAHHFINDFIRQHGLKSLREIRFGFLGIGSNNSFLQPEKEFSKIGPYYGRWSDETSFRDLVEIKIRSGNQITHRYMVSNCSLGFLAYANDIYNTDLTIQKFKRTSPKLAEIGTFLKTLKNFEPLPMALFSDFINFEGHIANINIMKSAYYTRDLFFPKDISPDSGLFQGLLLESTNKQSLFLRFLRAFLFGEMATTFSNAWRGSSLKVVCPQTIPIEIDGEVYWGSSFEFECLQQKLQVCG